MVVIIAQRQEKMAASARFQYGQRFGVVKSLKAEPMCTAKTVMADRSWWRQNWWTMCGKQFGKTGASQFRNSLVNAPRCLAHCCTKSSPGGTENVSTSTWRWGTGGSVFMAPDVDSRLLRHRHTNLVPPVRQIPITVVTMLRSSQWISVNDAIYSIFLTYWCFCSLYRSTGDEGWLWFPYIWSGQKPLWKWYLTPVVNFHEVRRA